MSWSEYARIRKIGEGAFGSAWLVKHNKTHSQFVIKQINVAKMQPKEREEARKEVAVLAQMKHPNIVSYIDSFDEVGNLCIVMDYCDGGDLYNKIRSMRGVAISEDQILDWFVQITLALKHVHDRKILHRDLKSQNIFLTKDGTIKLGDFGVAKVLGSTMDFARTAIGTPYYMSPEICEHKPYNNKTDVWSLGCILYEMINLRHPFEANNIQMLIYKILRGSFDQLNPKYSYELRNLVACMLKKNPRERPSVNGILRKAFIMKRCEKFLTNEKLVEEFSHTVLHGENFKNKIQSLANKPAAVGTPRVALTPRSNLNNGGGVNKPVVYDPSKVYKSPVVPRGPLIAQPQPQKAAQQPVEKKATPTPVVRKRPNSAQRESVESSSERNKPIGYLEQQRLKRVAAEEERLKKRHLELIEKQRQERINKAREAGWQHVLGDGLNKDENQPSKEEKSSQQGKQAGDVIRVDNYPYVNFIRGSAYNNIENNNKNDNNNNIYAHYHRQLDEFVERCKPVLEQQSEIARRMGTPAATPATPRPVIQGGLRRSAVGSRPGSKNNQILEDFLRRKEEYERNRLRGQKAMAVKPPTPTPAAATPGRGNDEKWAYEQRLMRVRQQNYENRRAVANKDILPSNVRMQKIAALKQQSEEQRQKLNKELEKKRIEAYEKERKAAIQAQQQQQQQQQNRPHSAADQSKSKEFKPEPPVNMTEVLSAIGVVGKKISKEEVLKNLNDEYHPRPESARKGWQKASDLSELENKTLYKSDSSNSSAATPRKIWDQPHDSVLRGFELAKVSPITLVPGQADFERTVLKMGTLKPTAKNLLLDMTMGQFDAKSAKMLRTCSVPDLSEPVASDDEKEAAQKNDKIKVVEKKMDSDELKLTTKRLFKSLEDLSKEEDGDNKENNSPSPVEMPRKKRADSNELVAEYDDISQVRETMESILYQSYSDSEEEDDDADVKIPKKEPKRRQKVNFTSSPVASISVSELPIDSLDLNKKKSTKKSLVINDDNDCETVVLNGEDESEEEDTEFEDEVKLPMPIQDNKARIQAIEETRQFLEQNLGPKNFLQAYPAIQNQIMVEEADPNEKGKKLEQRKSYELFKKKFPNKDLYMFFEFYELVMAEAKSNED